jgi:hypothetical protein
VSDLKVDGIISSTGTNTNLELSGKGSGGVKITDYLIQTKGADISSATSLTLGKDGNQFDVTGTTTITSIATQGIGSYVTLHFDGALTFTHDATNLILPGAANITTAAGDIAVMYEYASADWRCVSFTKASGAAVVAAGGAWSFIETVTASGAASVDFDGSFTSTYDHWMIVGTDINPASDADFWCRLDANGGASFDTGSTDYHWAVAGFDSGSQDMGGTAEVTEDSKINLSSDIVGGDLSANAGAGAMLIMHIMNPAGTTYRTMLGWELYYSGRDDTRSCVIHGSGNAKARTTATDSIQFLMASGNIDGTFRLYGLSDS